MSHFMTLLTNAASEFAAMSAHRGVVRLRGQWAPAAEVTQRVHQDELRAGR
jgi:hypothetical protein